ncbi:hypothetical protein BBJ28_00012088 [Nothophytophthora sp. Chile5]|nr:hypothetical protein BBJ28_00012088 [Nothophytophthora sp. Chile5]
MSSARALLTSLQDRRKRSPASVRGTLLEFASCCRHQDAKAAILAAGLEPLLELATDPELRRGDELELLLKLFVLILTGNTETKAKAGGGEALALAMQTLQDVVAGSGGSGWSARKRTKLLKRALELVDVLANTAEAQQQHKRIISTLVMLMTRTSEDASLLLRATDVFGRFIDGSLDRIQLAANEGAIAILIGLLKLVQLRTMELKRTACEVLLLMGEAPGTLQTMVTQNIVSVLGLCLRTETPGCETEAGVVRLLLRLTREARVFGQIVHEEMVPLLFRVVERNNNLGEITAMACTLIADLSEFARQCKLDLSPFLEVTTCRGKVLVLAATSHAQDAAVVDNTFRFFVNVSWNPVDLPQLINPETIEGLLSLYVLAGGSGHLAELAEHLVHVISRLSRSMIEQFTIQDEDVTLPALFLCLRNCHEDVRFASQVFAILTKHWKTQVKSVHSITGYVGIATVDICNFVREMIFSTDGAEVVLGCGGKDLLEILHTHLPARDSDQRLDADSLKDSSEGRAQAPALLPLAFTLVDMLEKVVLGCPDLAMISTSSTSQIDANKPILTCSIGGTSSRPGDEEYGAYVTSVLHNESCLFKALESVTLAKNLSRKNLSTLVSPSPKNATRDNVSEENTQAAANPSDGEAMQSSFCDMHLCESDPLPLVESDEEEMPDADVENIDEGNDDDSEDDDGYEKAGDAPSEIDELCGVTSAGVLPLHAIRSLPGRQGPPNPSKCAGRTKCTPITAFSHLEDKTWFYVDSAGVKYPKHPSRMDQAGQTNDEEGFLLEEPGFLEPCNVPNPEEAARFIEEATAKRAAFLADDINMRARIVYENTSMLEDWPRDKTAGIPAVLQNSCQPASHYPYSVPDKSKAFANLPTSLTFDSCFESGNLERAIQIGEYEYDLILRRDFNSSGHMQWFYFAVSNIQPAKESISSPQRGQKWRFNIVNLCKPSSLFSHGLQPVVYSVKDAHENRRGWLRSGTDIYYFTNPFVRAPRSAGSSSDALPTDAVPAPASSVGTYYTLTFTLEFRNTDDTYLIAHSYPYTLTMHQLHLNNILHRSGRDMHQILRHSSLCTTLSGRNCDLLTISDFSVGLQEVKARKAVFITSRVHPGEAQASWMMRGVIDFLLGDSDVARVLRRMFLFQIIPILNPDGVYYGNSRCALSACDLNRQWQDPSRAQHPTIFHAKELLFKERSSRGVAFYCDMHGHSRKKNVFMYGCDTKRKPNPVARTFAKLFSMQQTAKKYISFPDCSFKVSKNKETTARVVVANELKICWSFTLEASFCGANFGELQNAHFNTKHLHQVGTSLCETLFHACVGDANVRERLAANIDDATMCIPQYVEGYLREAGILNDRSPVVEDVTMNPRTALQKGKAGSGRKMPIDSSLKTASRKNSKSKVVGNSDSGARKVVGDADEGSGRRRKPSRQYPKSSMFAGSIELDDGEMRGVSPKSASFSFPSANMLGVQSRDNSMALSPPVNDLVTRSPKVPINRVRFRQVPNCYPVEEHNELVL